jgi:endonuclease/exonuclease/phosphatase family metal-dependent hydrolase
MMFYCSRFKLLNQSTIPLVDDKWFPGLDAFPTFAILVELAMKEGPAQGKSIYVVCTHLKAGNPSYEPVRCAQAVILLEKLSQSCHIHSPLILTGDFNTTIHNQFYGVYNGTKDDVVLDPYVPNGKPRLGARPPPLRKTVAKNRRKLQSAYVSLSAFNNTAKGDVPYTYFIRNFVTAIDFVWFSPEHLEVVELLDLPDEEVLRADPLPNEVWPSDHLSLLVRFSWLDV